MDWLDLLAEPTGPTYLCIDISIHIHGLPRGALVVKNLPANAGDVRDTGSMPGSGRSPGGREGNPLQSSCLENRMDRGAWTVWATVHRATKSRIRLSSLARTHAYIYIHTLMPPICATEKYGSKKAVPQVPRDSMSG